jgi:predicted RNase H-like HicB family nuclease
MQYQVFVQSRIDTTFIASVVGVPDCIAEGTTKEEAIAKATIALKQQLATGELVTIDLDPQSVEPETDPWIKHMGIFANDPTFDDFLAEVAAYRLQADAQEVDG